MYALDSAVCVIRTIFSNQLQLVSSSGNGSTWFICRQLSPAPSTVRDTAIPASKSCLARQLLVRSARYRPTYTSLFSAYPALRQVSVARRRGPSSSSSGYSSGSLGHSRGRPRTSVISISCMRSTRHFSLA